MDKIWLIGHTGYNKNGKWESGRTCFEFGAFEDSWAVQRFISTLPDACNDYNEETDETGEYYAFAVKVADSDILPRVEKYKDLQSVFTDIMKMSRECWAFGFRYTEFDTLGIIDEHEFDENCNKIYTLICKVRRAREKKECDSLGKFTKDFSDL